MRGCGILINKTRKTDVPLIELVGMLEKSPPHHVRGTAVFLTSDPTIAPAALLHNLKHNKVLHEKNVVLTVETVDTPPRRGGRPHPHRAHRPALPQGRDEVRLHGDAEHPQDPDAPEEAGLQVRHHGDLFFLSRRSIRPAAHSGMPLWQDRIFITLAKNANDATDFFQIPTGRVWRWARRSRSEAGPRRRQKRPARVRRTAVGSTGWKCRSATPSAGSPGSREV